MKTPLLFVVALASLTGCSFAARSPEMYRDDTQAVLAQRNNDIRACYDGVLKGDPKAQGRVTVQFKVLTESGKISEVVVAKDQTTAPEGVAQCVAKAIDGLALSPADQRTGEATWVYEFTPPPPPPPPAPPAKG